jgi:hypothetical protein
VGALAVAELCRSLGVPARVGGMTWERRPIDPRPGPRRLDEVSGVRRLNDSVALAGPEAGVAEAPAFRFAEGRMAEFLGEEVLLADPHPGPDRLGADLAEAARELGCDLVVLLDVGGDVLGHGDEPGLASPLCDGVVLAASARLAREVPVLGAIFGPGCDGELTPAEVDARLAEVHAAGGGRGAWGPPPAVLARLEAAVDAIPTEASAQAVAAARGEHGPIAIRGGRRVVNRTTLGAVTFFFDPAAALRSAARLGRAVAGAGSLEEAQDRLAALGVRTELAAEREAAREAA